jgi:pimeloyl-ACP methyl ester carboxylesterase
LAEVLGGAAYTAIVEVENIMPNAGTSSAAPILGGAGTSVVLNRRLASNSAGMFVSGGASISHTFSGTFEQIVRAVVAGDASTAAISANGQAATSSANPLVPTRWLGRDGSSDPAGGRQSGMFIRKIAFQPTAVSTASAALLSAAPARIRKETIYHPSSIDPASYPALDATICYDELQPNAPVLVLMHGWSENSASFVDDTYRRLARRGFFVIAPNMRARPAFTGRDASAREIVDILDAVDVVRQRYPEFAHARDAYMFGYSGGGGNVLAMAMKAPDAFNLFASHFGMSDYGYDATYGWYATNGSFQSDISNAVGGAPGASAAVDAAYRSRYAIEGIPANLQGGHLFLFHDTDDTLVSVEHSRQLAAAMTAEGNSRYTYHESAAGNWNRWEHSLPNGTAKIARTENTLLPRMQRREFRPWHFPLSGSARVHGFLRTKHFEIVLDDRKSSVATVSYDVAARSYTVTPVTAHEPIDVTITQGGLSISQTISGVTALVPS